MNIPANNEYFSIFSRFEKGLYYSTSFSDKVIFFGYKSDKELQGQQKVFAEFL